MPAAVKSRRFRRWFFRIVIGVLCAWFFGSGITTLLFTRRFIVSKPVPLPTVAGLNLQSVRLSTSDGQEIGGWVSRAGGQGAVVLLLHGIGDTRAMWPPTMQMLASHGHASMAIDLRGHGDSTGHVEDFGFSASKDVIAAVAYLRRNFPRRPIVLVGNSLGSAAAIFAVGSLDHEVAGYFLESPYRDLESAVKSRVDVVPPPLNWMATAGLRFWGRMLLPEPVSQISPIAHVRDIPADVPVIFVAARHDPVCGLWEVEDQYHAIEAHAKLLVVESNHHASCRRDFEKDYDAALLGLLKECDVRR